METLVTQQREAGKTAVNRGFLSCGAENFAVGGTFAGNGVTDKAPDESKAEYVEIVRRAAEPGMAITMYWGSDDVHEPPGIFEHVDTEVLLRICEARSDASTMRRHARWHA